jgi:hypothetical protein
MSAFDGTKQPIQNVRFSVAIGGKADLRRTARFDAIDPERRWRRHFAVAHNSSF